MKGGVYRMLTFHFIMPDYFGCKISENTENMADLP